MLLKPVLIAGDIDHAAMALTYLPPLPAPDPIYGFVPAEIPASYFCAARLPLPYIIPVIKNVVLARVVVDLTVRQILGLPGVVETEEIRAPRRNLDVQIIGKLDATSDNTNTITYRNMQGDISCQDSPANNPLDTIKANDLIDFSLYPSEGQIGGERILTVDRVFSNQNGKIVLLGKISTPYKNKTNSGGAQFMYPFTSVKKNPIWREEETLVVAKLRTSTDEAESLREHMNELEMLRIVTESKTRGMFPKFVGCGEVRIQLSKKVIMIPLLLMSHLPYPTITDLLRDPQLLPDNPYSTGDKRIFHHDSVLRDGLDCAVAALQFLGLRHGDLKSGNVVYRVGASFLEGPRNEKEEKKDGGKRGKVWLIDLESVEAMIPKDIQIHEVSAKEKRVHDRGVVKDIISDFWKYELCCANF